MVGTAREGVAAVLFDYAVIIIIIISFFVVFSLDKEVFCLHVTVGKKLSENMCGGGIFAQMHTNRNMATFITMLPYENEEEEEDFVR